MALLKSSRAFRRNAAVDVEDLFYDVMLVGAKVSASAIQRYITEHVRIDDPVDVVSAEGGQILLHDQKIYVGRLKRGRILRKPRISVVRRVVVEPREPARCPFAAGGIILAFDVRQDAHG